MLARLPEGWRQPSCTTTPPRSTASGWRCPRKDGLPPPNRDRRRVRVPRCERWRHTGQRTGRASSGAGLALFALTLGVFLVTINVTLVIVALPDIQVRPRRRPQPDRVDRRRLHPRRGEPALPPAPSPTASAQARAGDRLRDPLAGAAALCAVAPTIGWLLAFRVLMGIGGTVLTPTSMAIVANLYPDTRERARAIGLWGVSAGVGTGLGPIIGGAITDGAGWRAVSRPSIVGAIAVLIVIRAVLGCAARCRGRSTSPASCSRWPSWRR